MPIEFLWYFEFKQLNFSFELGKILSAYAVESFLLWRDPNTDLTEAHKINNSVKSIIIIYSFFIKTLIAK